MTIKSSSRKQVIIPMNANNSEAIILQESTHISNINRLLKGMKSEILADFICSNNKGVVIMTNKAAATSDLSIIRKYIKGVNNMDLENMSCHWLPHSKSYFKILGVLYLLENTNVLITSEVIEEVIKNIYIFNNIVLASCSHIIKASPKSDMAVIWVNIWGLQSSTKAKGLINRSFNVGCHIATIHGTNMNLDISQCKNCWK